MRGRRPRRPPRPDRRLRERRHDGDLRSLVAPPDLEALGDNVADLASRVQRGDRILKIIWSRRTGTAHLARRQAGEIRALEANRAAGGPGQLQHRTGRRGLAAAGLADDPERFALQDVEADPGDGMRNRNPARRGTRPIRSSTRSSSSLTAQSGFARTRPSADLRFRIRRRDSRRPRRWLAERDCGRPVDGRHGPRAAPARRDDTVRVRGRTVARTGSRAAAQPCPVAVRGWPQGEYAEGAPPVASRASVRSVYRCAHVPEQGPRRSHLRDAARRT